MSEHLYFSFETLKKVSGKGYIPNRSVLKLAYYPNYGKFEIPMSFLTFQLKYEKHVMDVR